MNISTETLGLTHGVDLSLEDDYELLTEVNEKAEDIMEKAYAEFNSFLKKKGLRNSMGVLTPKDGAKVLYHITDIEWDLDDEDATNAESLRNKLRSDLQGECAADCISESSMMKELDEFDEWLKTANIGDAYWRGDSSYVLEKTDNNLPKNVDAQNINGTVADYLSDTYYYLVKSYKVLIEIIDESEDSHYKKSKAAL